MKKTGVSILQLGPRVRVSAGEILFLLHLLEDSDHLICSCLLPWFKSVPSVSPACKGTGHISLGCAPKASFKFCKTLSLNGSHSEGLEPPAPIYLLRRTKFSSKYANKISLLPGRNFFKRFEKYESVFSNIVLSSIE